MKLKIFKAITLTGILLFVSSAIVATFLSQGYGPSADLVPNGSITATDEAGREGSCTPTIAIASPCNNTDSEAGIEGPSGSTRHVDNPTRSDTTTRNDGI